MSETQRNEQELAAGIRGNGKRDVYFANGYCCEASVR